MSYGVGCRCGSHPMLLWLWHRLVATALIRPLPWEPPHASGVAPKKTKKKKKKKKKKNSGAKKIFREQINEEKFFSIKYFHHNNPSLSSVKKIKVL